jgi:ubiquinone/menaquinone biosynthesis C-methylase UbiE
MSARQGADNLRVYSAPEVASHYAALDYLTPCEKFLFSTYLKPGAAILDVGVGGGRTTPYLASTASRYAGLDYSEKMIRLCRERFPQLEFLVSDASDLVTFEDASFDAVIMAFNVLDYVLPAEKRRQCLRECRRVLRPQGLFIFSSHNPRAVLIYPAWDRDRLLVLGRKWVSEASGFLPAAILVLTVAKWLHSWLRAAAGSAVRVIRRCFKLAFWHGEGCLVDPVHGGLVTHYWIPARAVAELEQCGFHMVRCMGDDYPRASRLWMTDWYYYVFQKTDRVAAGSPCV